MDDFTQGKSCRHYNGGNDESLSIADVAQYIPDQFRTKIAFTIRGTPKPQKQLKRYVPDVSRAKGELGLIEDIHLDVAILRTSRTVPWNFL